MKYQIRKGCFETNSSSMHSLIITNKNSNIRMTQQEIRDEFYLDADYRKDRKDKNILRLYFYNDEINFGRSPFDVLSSFRDKLNYAIASICGGCWHIEDCVKADEKFDEIFVPLLKNLIGVDDVVIDSDTKHFIVYSGESSEYFETVEEVPYDKLVESDEDPDAEDSQVVGRHYQPFDKDGRKIEDAWYDVCDYGDVDHQSCGLLQGFLKKYNMSLEDYLVRKDILVVIDGDESCIFSSMMNCGLISKNNIVLQFPDRMCYDTYEYYEKERTDEETNKIAHI